MDPTLLIIIVFILAPLIERLLKAGKQQEPPELPRQRPRPRVEAPREQHRQQHDEARNRVVIRREEEEAATMLPDDLWEILTGEKRTPPPPPAPRREPEAADVEMFEEEVGQEEARSLETTSAGEWLPLPPEPEPAPPARPAPQPRARDDFWLEMEKRNSEGYDRPLPRHDPGRVVSLEKLEIDDEKRHTEFHRKLEATRRPRQQATPNAWRFTNDDDLRKAIVMAEVLGRPKGLE